MNRWRLAVALLPVLAWPARAGAETWGRFPELMGWVLLVALGAIVVFALLWWLTARIPNMLLRALVRGCALFAGLWFSGRFEGPGAMPAELALPVAIVGCWFVELNIALKRRLRERD